MKIGIIVHSHTGNTLSVAQRLETALTDCGHTVKLDRVTALNEDPQAGEFVLKYTPSVNEYDAVIFAAPVRGFSASPIMKLYLNQLSSLTGKNVGVFVTQHFPYAWMGGRSSIKQMQQLCNEKDGVVLKTGAINWTNKKREQQIATLIDGFKELVNK